MKIKRRVFGSTNEDGERTVLLFGPPFGKAIAAGYGGGTGGYTRNMKVYVETLRVDGVRLEPLFRTVRGEKASFFGTYPVRFLVDCLRIHRAVRKSRPAAIHALGSYRTALPLEVLLALICRLSAIPLIYDIKAGQFVTAFEGGSWLYKAMMRFVLFSAAALLVEGQDYERFLRERFGLKSHYFPNFVPQEEVPATIPDRLSEAPLKLLYVGFCYEGKGVHQLLRGCGEAASCGISIRLTLIGEEEEKFKSFADSFSHADNLSIVRLGRRPHAEVLQHMQVNDVYCYPTAHAGEGHNNSINEAMMNGMIIVTTRHGFLESVLTENGAIFLDGTSPAQIAGAIDRISRHPIEAREIAAFARNRCLQEFTSARAGKVLEAAYRSLIGSSSAESGRKDAATGSVSKASAGKADAS